MDRTGHILILPLEILLLIAEKLKGSDVLAFSKACQRFSAVCGNLRSLNFADDFYLKSEDVKMFFRTTASVKTLSSCDFTNCYYIPSKILGPALEKCTNLQVLRVANANLTCNLLAKILAKCPKIEQLSLSIGIRDFWMKKSLEPQSLDKILSQAPAVCPWECLFNFTSFKGSEEALKNLLKLELHIPPDSVILGVILSACENLENLELFIDGDADTSNFYGRLILRKLERIFVHPMRTEISLKSLILHLPTEDCITRFEIATFISCHLTKPKQASRLKCFWADQLPCPAVERNLAALACNDGPDFADGEPISTLKSIRVSDYLSTTFYAPGAKLIECLYAKKSAERFDQFCRIHQHLTRLKLNVGDLTSRLPSEWCLPQLTALSINPSLVNGGGLLRSALVSNKQLEELEICSFTSQSATKAKLCSQELSLIGQLLKLKSLTLGNFLIDDGNFFLDILKGCRNLESLRLNDIGQSALCSYTRHLCSALIHARHLTHLRIKQNNVTPLGQLLKALENCSTLVQLSLIVPSKVPPNLLSHSSRQREEAFSRFMIHFVDCFPKLAVFYMALSVPALHCSGATKALVNKFQPMRPAFCCSLVNLQDVVPLISVGRISLHGHLPGLQALERPSLPPIHTNFIYDYFSKVCDLPTCEK